MTSCDLSKVSLSSSYITKPLDSTFVVLIQTAAGAIYKVGEPVESATSVTVSYARLKP